MVTSSNMNDTLVREPTDWKNLPILELWIPSQFTDFSFLYGSPRTRSNWELWGFNRRGHLALPSPPPLRKNSPKNQTSQKRKRQNKRVIERILTCSMLILFLVQKSFLKNLSSKIKLIWSNMLFWLKLDIFIHPPPLPYSFNEENSGKFENYKFG